MQLVGIQFWPNSLKNKNQFGCFFALLLKSFKKYTRKIVVFLLIITITSGNIAWSISDANNIFANRATLASQMFMNTILNNVESRYRDRARGELAFILHMAVLAHTSAAHETYKSGLDINAELIRQADINAELRKQLEPYSRDGRFKPVLHVQSKPIMENGMLVIKLTIRGRNGKEREIEIKIKFIDDKEAAHENNTISRGMSFERALAEGVEQTGAANSTELAATAGGIEKGGAPEESGVSLRAPLISKVISALRNNLMVRLFYLLMGICVLCNLVYDNESTPPAHKVMCEQLNATQIINAVTPILKDAELKLHEDWDIHKASIYGNRVEVRAGFANRLVMPKAPEEYKGRENDYFFKNHRKVMKDIRDRLHVLGLFSDEYEVAYNAPLCAIRVTVNLTGVKTRVAAQYDSSAFMQKFMAFQATPTDSWGVSVRDDAILEFENLIQNIVIRVRDSGESEPLKILNIIHDYLHNDYGFRFNGNVDFLKGALSHELKCDFASLIFYEVGEQLNLPIEIREIYADPVNHIFVGWRQADGSIIYWEPLARGDTPKTYKDDQDVVVRIGKLQGITPVAKVTVRVSENTILANEAMRLFVNTKDIKERIHLFKRAKQLDPENPVLYVILGDKEKAIELAEKRGGEDYADFMRELLNIDGDKENNETGDDSNKDENEVENNDSTSILGTGIEKMTAAYYHQTFSKDAALADQAKEEVVASVAGAVSSFHVDVVNSVETAKTNRQNASGALALFPLFASVSQKDKRRWRSSIRKAIELLRTVSNDGRLEGKLINMPMDIGPIPYRKMEDDELRQYLAPYMKTIALLVSLHNELGFDIRYKLIDTVGEGRLGIAQEVLESQLDSIASMATVDAEVLKDRVRTLHSWSTNIIEAPILSHTELEACEEIPENTYPWALQNVGYGVPDYVRAQTIALTLAASSIRKQEETEEEWRSRVEELYYPRLSDIIQKSMPDKIFNLKTLFDMVEYASVRLSHVLDLALPPAIKMPVNKYFEIMHDIIKYA